MRLSLKYLKRNHWIIIYKLLYDALFLMLILFFGQILAENLLPGIITNHLSFFLTISVIGVILILTILIERIAEIDFISRKKNKKTTSFLLFFLVLIIFNNLWRAGFLIAGIILGLAILLGYYTYQVIAEE